MDVHCRIDKLEGVEQGDEDPVFVERAGLRRVGILNTNIEGAAMFFCIVVDWFVGGRRDCFWDEK
jgi:hypothetical protein